MPPRSKASALPPEVRKWLDRALLSSNFAEYDALAAACRERGHHISKSALQRYGSKLEERLAAIRASTEAAAAIAEAAPDDQAQRSAAVISLIETEIFEVLYSLQKLQTESADEAGETPAERAKLLANVARAVSQLSRANVFLKQFQTQVKAKLEETLQTLAKQQDTAGTPLIGMDAIRIIREQVYGLMPKA